MCINSQLQDGMALCCSVNPVAGQGDNDYTIKPAEKVKSNYRWWRYSWC